MPAPTPKLKSNWLGMWPGHWDFVIAKYWKQPRCPSVNEWIKKLWYIHAMGYFTAERKKELFLIATAWMELESLILSEISQVVKDKYHTISPLTGT